MEETLRPHLVQFGAIAIAAVALWFFWKLARAVVKWGFFVMYFVMGALLSLLLQSNPTTGITITGGLAFAWTVMAIKSKLWKLIGAAAVLAALPFFGPMSKAIAGWSEGGSPRAKAPQSRPK